MSRPVLIERASYIPALPVEEFIVTLLRAKITGIIEALPELSASGIALDVGCGRQPFRKLLEERGYRYLSIDAQNPLGIVDFVAEIDKDLPAELTNQGPFDFVLCTEVLEHVADWDKAFSNFLRLVKPEGRLLITCPHFYILHEEPYDFWRATIYALQSCSAKWDFDSILVEKVGGSWDILGTMLGANLDAAYAVRRTMGNRILAFTIDKLTRAIFLLLKTRILQRRINWGRDRYPLYLSNVALFQKRGETSPAAVDPTDN